MGKAILLVETLKIVFLTGGIIYLIFGILTITENKEIIERMGTNIRIHVKKETKDEKEIEKKVSLFLSLEFFIASIIDFILMIILEIIHWKINNNYNHLKEENKMSFNNQINDTIYNNNQEDSETEKINKLNLI